MTCIQIPGGVMCVQPTFKPGDQAPEGYLAWHEWAETQHKAGLRQKECGRCGKWKYPQELSDTVDSYRAQTKRGTEVIRFTAVCHKCATPSNAISRAQIVLDKTA